MLIDGVFKAKVEYVQGHIGNQSYVVMYISEENYLHEAIGDGGSSHPHLEFCQTWDCSYLCWQAVPYWDHAWVVAVLVVVTACGYVVKCKIMGLLQWHGDGD